MRDMSLRDCTTDFAGGGARDSPASTRRGFDYLIVGAGFDGSVLADRLAAGLNTRAPHVYRRPHIDANADGYNDESGDLFRRDGPYRVRDDTARGDDKRSL